MRILYVAPNIRVPGTNGGSTHVRSVLHALGRRHDVLLIARVGSTEPGVLAVGYGVGTPLKHLLPCVYFARTVSAVRRFAPDVVYERYSAFGLGIAFGKALGVPTVLMTLDRDASALSLRHSDRIVATSPDFLSPKHLDKFREVRWGVDVDVFAGASGEQVRSDLGAGDRPIVAYSGSFADWHGLDLLMDVAAGWRGRPPLFLLVGDGPDRARLERLAAARGLTDSFVFIGAVPHDDLAPYLAAATACVAPYAPARHPIFRVHGMNRDPLKVLEYMALAKPSITIDTPRMRELFADGEEVALYRPDDAESLRTVLRRVLEDEAFAARIGLGGAELVAKRYSWDRHALELEAVFEEVTAARRGPSRTGGPAP